MAETIPRQSSLRDFSVLLICSRHSASLHAGLNTVAPPALEVPSASERDFILKGGIFVASVDSFQNRFSRKIKKVTSSRDDTTKKWWR
jgi:hypothetical protein